MGGCFALPAAHIPVMPKRNTTAANADKWKGFSPQAVAFFEQGRDQKSKQFGAHTHSIADRQVTDSFGNKRIPRVTAWLIIRLEAKHDAAVSDRRAALLRLEELSRASWTLSKLRNVRVAKAAVTAAERNLSEAADALLEAKLQNIMADEQEWLGKKDDAEMRYEHLRDSLIGLTVKDIGYDQGARMREEAHRDMVEADRNWNAALEAAVSLRAEVTGQP